MIPGLGLGVAALFFLLLALLVSAIRILREYERGVVFQLGRFWDVKGPGLIVLIPVVQQMVRMDLRYLRKCSFGLDLRILVRTVRVVLMCDGAR